jgi:hypothetical protein
MSRADDVIDRNELAPDTSPPSRRRAAPNREELHVPPPSRLARLARAALFAAPLLAIAAGVAALLVTIGPTSKLQLTIDIGGFLLVAIGVGWQERHRGRRHGSAGR